MNWELDIGMQKMARYAAYQDRSRKELVQKLNQIGCPPENQEELLGALKDQGFWDEERFARTYVRGKFRQKGWGKMKIKQGLWAKGIDGELAELALSEEIAPQEYRMTLERELRKKMNLKGWPTAYDERQKIRNSMQQKGFEAGLVSEAMKEMEEEKG